MPSRRDILRSIGMGAAVAATGLGTARAAAAAQRNTLRAFANGGDTESAPWWLLSPLQPNSSIGLGWSVTALSRVERGAAVLTLTHRSGEVARVHICAHAGKPRGLAHTALFDMLLMDGGQGDQRTPEGLGRALVGVARRVRRIELREGADLDSVSRMLTHPERVELYGPETLT